MSVSCCLFSWWIRQRRRPVWPASDYDLVGSGSRHTALFSLRLFQGCARIRESRYIPTGSSPTRRIQGPRYVNIYNYIYMKRIINLNPYWHELWKQEKCSSLAPSRGIFYKSRWVWQGLKLTRLMSIFTSKKVWKFLIKIQLTKSDPKRTRS